MHNLGLILFPLQTERRRRKKKEERRKKKKERRKKKEKRKKKERFTIFPYQNQCSVKGISMKGSFHGRTHKPAVLTDSCAET